ncbi:glycerol-3-phosphate dehydrogenase [Roseobacter sp.]|uniref:glycerol-3-phosphate dehydrogenase n=1 Tax=Roseobacter sp. TaxID=1907202 RepID=UPI00385B27B7
MSDDVDLFIIGGGVNGAGIARDAAGRGLSVVLCEKDDLAAGTSSRSGKLVHGGLRYLEYYEFRLVREALIEREVLLNAAPHIIWPMRFVLPHSPTDRPAWLVRLGLFLYDNLGGRKRLPGTRSLNLKRDPEGASVKDDYSKGFEYSDCWVDDARLVVLNAVDAYESGAEVLTRTSCTTLHQQDGSWIATVEDTKSGQTRKIRAKAVVNAAGPWVNDVIGRVAGSNSSRSVKLVKGSHIIVTKFWEGQHAYLVQNHDKRVIFINPYEGDKALIGTTDIAYEGDPNDVTVDQSEITYLIDAVNRYFKNPIRPSDVIESFSGVRPLFDDGNGNPSAVTRDYVLDLDRSRGAPLLNIFGGKITTYRKLAEHAVNDLKTIFPEMGDDWTATKPLPGGDIPNADFETFLGELQDQNPWLPRDLARHYARLYGTRAAQIINGASEMKHLGTQFADLLYEAELAYLVENEWAVCTEDVLKRRTKHGLTVSPSQVSKIDDWFKNGTA